MMTHHSPPFDQEFEQRLPQTAALLRAGNLVLHSAVERVVLTGSRGPGGRPRPDSDIDLSLIVATESLPGGEPEREQLLRAVLETTLAAWHGPIECDLAAIFDERTCGLRCLAGQLEAPPPCAHADSCRFGLFKLQKGFSGYVPWSMIVLERIYPVLEIWSEGRQGGSGV